VAEAIARQARSMDADVVRVVDAAERGDVDAAARPLGISVATLDALPGVTVDADAAVVVTQGHYDEQALEVLLAASLPYVGLVASRKRGATVRGTLESAGVVNVGALRSPAGLDLGAESAADVAVSILAEIVQTLTAYALEQPPIERTSAEATAIDPICGMSVGIASARHIADIDGTAYYFCCAACRVQFLDNPQAYVARR
jgi:xanthine dehydrogenase accessory factor